MLYDTLQPLMHTLVNKVKAMLTIFTRNNVIELHYFNLIHTYRMPWVQGPMVLRW